MAEYTPEEIEKLKQQSLQLRQDIEQLVQSTPEFDTIESAKSKINTFIS